MRARCEDKRSARIIMIQYSDLGQGAREDSSCVYVCVLCECVCMPWEGFVCTCIYANMHISWVQIKVSGWMASACVFLCVCMCGMKREHRRIFEVVLDMLVSASVGRLVTLKLHVFMIHTSIRSMLACISNVKILIVHTHTHADGHTLTCWLLTTQVACLHQLTSTRSMLACISNLQLLLFTYTHAHGQQTHVNILTSHHSSCLS